MSSKNQINITLPLDSFVKSHLGYGYWHDRAIDSDIASIIYALTKNEHTCYIQWVDRNGVTLEQPILWDYGAWTRDTERWLVQKNFSDKQRVARFIQEANVKIVAKAISKELLIEGEMAIVTAYSMVTKNKVQQMRAIGVYKLIEREEELP